MPYSLKRDVYIYRQKRTEYRKQELAKAIAHLGGKCVDCNGTTDLQFHHREPKQKTFTIGRRIHLGFIKIQDEIDKCDLVCKTCHRLRHNSKYNQHGTRATYAKGCLCLACKRANTEYEQARNSTLETP